MAKRATAKEVAERAGVSRTTVSFVLNNVPGMRISDETRQAAVAQGYKVLFEPVPPEAADTAYRQQVRERHVDGFVLSGPCLDNYKLLRTQVEAAPVVLLGQLPNS